MKMSPLEHLRALIQVSLLLSQSLCVTQSAEKDGDLHSQEEPAHSQLSSSFQLCAMELAHRSCCTQSRPGTFPLSAGKCTWWYLHPDAFDLVVSAAIQELWGPQL